MEHDTNASGAGFLIRPVADDDNDVLAGLLRDVMEEFGAAGAGTSLHDPEMLDMAAAYAGHGSAYFVDRVRRRPRRRGRPRAAGRRRAGRV